MYSMICYIKVKSVWSLYTPRYNGGTVPQILTYSTSQR